MVQTQLPATGEVTEAHVDWLTSTYREEAGRRYAQAVAPLLLAAEQRAGNPLTEWTWESYVGWHSGQVSIGDRPDGTIVRLSGSGAATRWRDLVTRATNVSRLDLAVTVRLNGTAGTLASDAYAAASRASFKRGKALLCSLVVSSDGGATAYLGSRISDKFGRVYNKAIESKQPEYAGCWRYEVELKRGPALRMARWLLTQPDESAAIRNTVGGYFQQRGVAVPFPLTGTFYIPPPEPQRTDDRRRLEWFADQIRPVVRSLLERQQRTTVLQALGLVQP